MQSKRLQDFIIGVLSVLSGLIVLALAYLIITRYALPLPASLVPFGTPGLIATPTLDPAIWARVNAGASPYLCPVVNEAEAVEIATCQDCMYYPVDKTHGLPATYTPELLPTGLSGGGFVTPIVQGPLAALFAEAQRRGLLPSVTSAYRSYAEQAFAFKAWVDKETGRGAPQSVALLNAARYSARPGFSEHQLGTAIDVNCAACVPFDDQDARNLALWKFLEDEAYKYGFILSYPRGIEALTGYMYEPWHIRYIGIFYATDLFAQGYLQGSGACLRGFLRALKLP
jgi:LAS superfamily LD-carboxypeptidase LdcB